MMRKTNDGRSPAGVLLPSAAAGLLLTLLAMLVGAVLLHRRVLPENGTAPYALAALALGTLLAGWMAAKRAPGRKLFWALGAGLVVFLVLLAAGLLLRAQPIDLVSTAASLLCALAASALGGFAGANMRRKKQYSHTKK